MNVEEFFFRDMYRQICLLTDYSLAKNFAEMFDGERINSLLTYGYIDAAEGFTFSILGGAQISIGRLKIFPINYNEAAIVRRKIARSAEIKILSDDYALAFRDRIQMIDDIYAVAAAREETRYIKTLDAFRHPDYPDDVVVYFLDGEHQPELIWVRCESIDENILTGKLLNEPRSDFGCHEGDSIKFGVAQIQGRNILLRLPTT